MVIFRLMAAIACGIISRPDCIGVIAESHLIEQRKQERHAADARAA